MGASEEPGVARAVGRPPPEAPAGAAARRYVVRRLPWRVRRMQDEIVPTLPLPVGTAEDIGRLREKMRREREERRPPGFSRPIFEEGYVFLLPDTEAARGLRWRLPAGAPVRAGTAGGGAQVGWPQGAVASGTRLDLLDGGGELLVRIEVGAPADVVDCRRGRLTLHRTLRISWEGGEDPRGPDRTYHWEMTAGAGPAGALNRTGERGAGRHEVRIALQGGADRIGCTLIESGSGWGLSGGFVRTVGELK